MKFLFSLLLVFSCLVPVAIGNDKTWARIGQGLVVTEGLRILSGGRVDPVGTITDGISSGFRRENHERVTCHCSHCTSSQIYRQRREPRSRYTETRRIWVPGFWDERQIERTFKEFEWVKGWDPIEQRHVWVQVEVTRVKVEVERVWIAGYWIER